MSKISLEGPMRDLTQVRAEIIGVLDGQEVVITSLAKKKYQLFDNREFGSAPLMEFLIQFGAGVSAIGVAKVASMVSEKIKSVRSVKMKIEESSESGSEDESK